MLNFFKRKPEASEQPSPAAQTRPRAPVQARGKAAPVMDPPPLPEVTEGNLESDWAMWEDSVAFQDSQMPSTFGPLDSVRDRTRSSKERPDDPFATVRKRGQ